jgi:DNA-binding response OmpR family regulator
LPVIYPLIEYNLSNFKLSVEPYEFMPIVLDQSRTNKEAEVANSSILLVNGEDKIYEVLDIYMNMAGYYLLVASNIARGLSMIEEASPELVLLDVSTLPDNRWELCRRFLENPLMPVIVLSDLQDEADMVNGFRAGADDYIVKPFSCAVLIERIGAILRRSGRKETPGKHVSSGEVAINLERKQVTVNGQRIQLTPKEFKLLEVLARHANNTIPIDRLLSEVWGYEYSEDPRFVKQYIWNLRKKIEDDPKEPKHLITRRGYGYRFE